MGLSDLAALNAVLSHKADSYGAGETLSAAIDTAGYHQMVVVYNAGTTASGGTTDVKVTASTTSSGTYSDVTGASFTQVTTANDEAIYVGRVNLQGADRYIKISATQATAAAEFSITCLMSCYDSNDGSTFAFEV